MKVARFWSAGFLWSLLLAAIAGCDPDGADVEWPGTIETTASGKVRVTNPAVPLWSDDDAWHLEREVVLGEADGEAADVFASISAIEADAAGNIYVLDRQNNDLRTFDATGGHVRTVGRSGEGPGEYTSATGLRWLAEDSLLVIDQEGSRYSVLDAQGNHVRSVRRNLGFYGWVFSGGLNGDRVYEVSSAGREDDTPVLIGTPLREADADGRSPASMDTIRLARLDGPIFQSYSMQSERGAIVMSVPFTGSRHYYLDGNAGLWHGHGGTPHLYHSTFGGDTLTEIVLGIQPAPVSAEEVEQWASRQSVERFKAMGGDLDLGRLPDTKPYYDGITVDPDGNIWLTLPATAQRAAFVVLDPDGRYLGRLQVDGVDRDEYVTPVVRSDRLYFVGRDELDVPRVYVYRIVRSGSESVG